MATPDSAVLETSADSDAPAVDSSPVEGAPPAAGDAEAGTEPAHIVVAHGLSQGALARLGVLEEIEVAETIDRAGESDLILISTRIPTTAGTALVHDLTSRVGAPVVAVVHPGGEGDAVALLGAGAAGVVAEGNEEAVRAFLGDEPADGGLVESYEENVGRRNGGVAPLRNDRDALTRVAGPGALAARLAAGTGGLPRLGVGRIVGLTEAGRRLSGEGRDLLRRRIVRQCQELCSHHGAVMYATGSEDFAVVADDLGAAEFEVLAEELKLLTHGFSPDRDTPLVLAFGHAGPESSDELDLLHDLAIRSAEMAADDPDHPIVGAERLTVSLAAATELATVMGAVAEVERRDGYPPAHGERVARTAVAIAESMHVGARLVMEIGLAARLHHLGKLVLGPEAVAGNEETLDGDALDAFRDYPARGAAILAAAAGRGVADAVAAHHERWDGSGFPNGLEGEAIPLAARVIAVADLLDRWAGDHAGSKPDQALLDRISAASGSLFDPDVVEAFLAAYGPAVRAS